jgi:hypothetical protein
MMTQHSQGNLDDLLTQHLAVALNPQRGRAADAFREHLRHGAAGVKAPVAPAPIPFPRNAVPRQALWLWAGVPSLIAACLALVVTMQFVGSKPHPTTTVPPPPTGSRQIVFDAPQVDRLELSRDINGGIAMGEDGPVRVIHHQSMRHAQWVDPEDNATYSITEEPNETVNYLKVQPY